MLRDLKRALVATGMLLALSGFSLAHDEQAQGSDVAQRASQQGYNDGFQHGQEDRERSAGYNYQGDEYQRADRGYEPNLGDREQFVTAYREGYRSGYDDGFNGRSQRSGDPYDPGRDDPGRDDRGRDDRYRDDDRDGRRGSNDLAYDIGYRDGIEGAQKDIRRRKGFDYNDHEWYRDADHGYSRSYGDKHTYRLRYREGYEAGYRDTYDTAYAVGYRDGIVGARKDMRRRKSPDPGRHSWYREAKRGYDGRAYGNRENYRQRYREGYLAGYNDAYRGQG